MDRAVLQTLICAATVVAIFLLLTVMVIVARVSEARIHIARAKAGLPPSDLEDDDE